MCVPKAQILLPYQRDWVIDRSPVKMAEKSRRTGITWCTAAEAVIVATEKASRGGMDVYFMTYAEEDAKDFIRDCEDWAKAIGALHGEMWVEEEEGYTWGDSKSLIKVKVLSIEFPSGFRISALAGRPRKFRGKQGYAIIDEAAFVDDLAAIMQAATAFLMWGGRIALISTHYGETNHFNVLLNEAREGEKSGWTVHSIPLGDAIDQGLAQRIAVMRGEKYSAEWAEKWEADLRASYGEAAAEELDCVPSKQGAGYFDPDAVNLCRSDDCKVIRWEQPPEWFENSRKERARQCQEWIDAVLLPELKKLNPMRGCFCGIDYGRSSDMSSWVIAQMHDAVRKASITLELRNIPQAQQEQILDAVVRNTPRLGKVAIDKTGNGHALYDHGRRS